MNTTDIKQKIANFFTSYPTRTFEKRHIIIAPDDPLPGVFYLTEGRVSQYDITTSGVEVVVNVFKPGAFFPMSWAINKTQNVYFFEASTKVVTHIVPPDDTVTFLQDNPDVIFNLLSRVYRGADGLLRRMAHLMGGDAKSRLLFELLNAAYRFGEPQTDGKLFVPLSENDLARHSGLARETVNRNMQELKKDGLIEITHKGFIVPDTSDIEARLGREL
jgi:CRP/FNR family transcriptional regulator